MVIIPSSKITGLSEMRHYFFHLKRGQMTLLDREGVQLANIEEASREATLRGREIVAREGLKGRPPSGATIVIADEYWRPVLEVPLKDALEGDALD